LSTSLLAFGLVTFSTFVGAGGALCFKLGADKLKLDIISLIKNFYLILGAFLYVFGTVFFIAGLRGGELSVLYPLTALTYVWVLLLSVYYLKERMNLYKCIGFIAIWAGVIIIGING